MNQAAAKASAHPLTPPADRRVGRFRRRGASLGLVSSDISDLMQQIERGFPFNALLRLEVNSGLSLAVLASAIGVPERTLARRRAAGRLEPSES